jgi:sugar (pentulose or hexulose) kinase
MNCKVGRTFSSVPVGQECPTYGIAPDVGLPRALARFPLADILKKPIHLPREAEACAQGAAMAATLAAGIYPDFDAAADAMVQIERTVEPRAEYAGLYDELFGRCLRMYAAVNGSASGA